MLNTLFFNQFPRITAQRLILRQLELDDAAELQYIRSHPLVMRFMDSPSHKNVETSENFIAENLKRYGAKKGIFWALVSKSSEDFLGDLAFWKIDSKNSRGELGYTLKPEFWRKGYMKEALTAVIAFGFNDLNLHSLEANINPENENSRILLKKLGFQKEAYFRENYYYDGQYLDSEIYSLLRYDFSPPADFYSLLL